VQRITVPDNNRAARTFLTSRTGSLAFDIGANIGQSAKVLAPNFTTVISCEPADDSWQLLAIEAPANVRPLNIAVAEHDGELLLFEAENSTGSGQLVYGPGLEWGRITGQVSVPCRTLDSLAAAYGQPDFVKVDVEGSELRVLQGATQVLAGRPGSWLVEVHHASHEPGVRDYLGGYTVSKHVHEHLPVGDPVRTNHFYLVAE
jgi:FkbM family methyltransferase